jgi:hypothetical protein
VREAADDCQRVGVEDEATLNLHLAQLATAAGIATQCVKHGFEVERKGRWFAVSQWVRANRPQLDIMLVGNIERAADVAAELCENGPTLSKPYEPQTVVDRIRRLLAERKPRGS